MRAANNTPALNPTLTTVVHKSQKQRHRPTNAPHPGGTVAAPRTLHTARSQGHYCRLFSHSMRCPAAPQLRVSALRGQHTARLRHAHTLRRPLNTNPVNQACTRVRADVGPPSTHNTLPPTTTHHPSGELYLLCGNLDSQHHTSTLTDTLSEPTHDYPAVPSSLLACCLSAEMTHTPNDLPHPQLSAALGLLNWKPPPIKASL